MNDFHPEIKKEKAGLTMVDIGVATVDTMDIPTMVDIMDGDARRGTLKKLSGMILANPRLKADLMDTMAGVDMDMVVIVATMDILTIVVMVMDIGDVRRDPLMKKFLLLLPFLKLLKMYNLHPEMKRQKADLMDIMDGVVIVDTMDIPTMVDIMDGDARRGTLKKLSGMISVKGRRAVALILIMDTTMEVTVLIGVDTDGEDIVDTDGEAMDIGDNCFNYFPAFPA